MHRTGTALKLLTAAAALTVCGCVSGCVSVEARPAPARPPAPPTRHEERVGPQIVQAPAREGLDTVLPPNTPPPPRPATPKTSEPEPPAVPHHPRVRSEAPPHHPTVKPRRKHPRPAPALPSAGDTCALGKGYGGWTDDSPAARICREAYGH
ncbi:MULTISPECIES: hypothetical protein [unclassified Streptomyces]|uniref:hypothetical protein n=1 Tax=unclassified Streptomyces TaxID=2593676 RepID=UPI0037F63BCD